MKSFPLPAARTVSWKPGLAAWLFSSLVLFAIGGLTWWSGLSELYKPYYYDVVPIRQGWLAGVLGAWQRWDAIHYIRIASQGYSQVELSAYFPFYPLAARLLGGAVGQTGALVNLLLVANLSLIGCLVLLDRMAAELYGRQVAGFAVIALVTYPYGYFFHAPYTEASALLLTMATLYAAWHNRWPLAFGLGLLAGLSRPTVFPLSLALLYLAWKNRPAAVVEAGSAPAGRLSEGRAAGLMRRWLPFLAAGAPVLGTVLFLGWRILAGFPGYSELVRQEWGRHFAWPWQTAADLVRMAGDGIRLYTWMNLAMLVIILALTGYGLRRLPPVLQIYQLSQLALLVANTLEEEPWGSLGRYTLLLFPTYFLVALWAHTPARRLAWFTFALLLQLFLAWQFFMWGWTG